METGLEKAKIEGYAHKQSSDNEVIKYECEFEIPENFGEVGAVLVENEHHKEMYLKSIELDGFPLGPVVFTCNSWVHSKFDNPEKRIFFTNKSSPSDGTRTVGHGDKKKEPWWPVLKTPDDLIKILTTIIWVTSGHHATVNFGQYDFVGYFPNRPTIARTNMPTEEPREATRELFLKKPEEYLCKDIEPQWTEDPVVNAAFERFNGRLRELEGVIDARNADETLKNRHGAGVVPYELLKPVSEPGVAGKGVPNSISI